ncbi:MAG: hypothetical protein JXR31_09665, partial [Prolixibacteraceae bacterium]|nr:hypothetical protein [Prolixibacteraceae bacterium]
MMQENKLHIVSFDVPYPPDYGGVIDVFYKLRGLSEVGIKIYLHCYQYGRNKSPELEKFCEKVFYYPRKTGIKYAFSKKPYIVAGRKHPELLKNILQLKAPVLFEGLHSCFFIDHPELKNYRKILRAHNIEHDYYSQLTNSESSFFKRTYFKKEAIKLKRYERVIQHAESVISISPSDQEYFQNIHPSAKFVPAFHEFDSVCSLPGKGDYFLFHGNLSVPENIKSVHYLLDEVFKGLKIKLVIAGKNPSRSLL